MTDLLDAALATQLGRPVYDRINQHLADGQRAEAALQRARDLPRQPVRFVPSGRDGHMYVRGWKSAMTELDFALADCGVCGGIPVVYRNFKDQPFCWPCAVCDCGQDVCVRTKSTAQDTTPDTVPAAEDDRPDMGCLNLGDAEPASADTVRTTSEDSSPDTDLGSGFVYTARVPRRLMGAAFAEGVRLLQEHTSRQADEPAPDSGELGHPDPSAQVSDPEDVDANPERLLHLVHGSIPLHEHLAAADRAQQTITTLRRRNGELSATLGDVLARFIICSDIGGNVGSDIGGNVVRTGFIGGKTIDRWRRVLTRENQQDGETDYLPKVQGRCPACRRESLFLGSGGYVTCAQAACSKPDAATAVLEDPPYAAGDCCRTDCTTALAAALERANRAQHAYDTLRTDTITVAKYIGHQQTRNRLWGGDGRARILATLAVWVKDPGPLAPLSGNA
ncbi:hypothetical protein ACFVHS_25170 [Streptomyces sp. NPDC057746]|uniref:hypothetical protein n=1 Tax=Streptomyces sp. NPDC057746 TaxID=3346237 RepID=UPI00368FC66D